jgi:hypothetical protein
MKTFYALLIAALFTTAACKKKDEAAKSDPATDPAAKTAEPAKADPAAPDPATAEPAAAAPAGGMSVDDAGKMANEFADKLVKATADAGDDCAKLGTNLKALTEEAKKAAAAEKEFDKSPDNKKAFQEKYAADLNKKMETPMKAWEKCMTNADVKGFIESLGAE